SATTFVVDQADIGSDPLDPGNILGSSGTDTLQAAGTVLDLRSTTVSSVEVLKAGNAGGTTFMVDATDLVSGAQVIGGAGSDTLFINATSFDLNTITLSSVEAVQFLTGSNGTTFTLTQNDITKGKSLTGTSNFDTVQFVGTGFDLGKVTLSG